MKALRFLTVIWAAAVLIPLNAATSSVEGPATVTGVQVGETQGGTQIALNSDGELAYLDYYLADPFQIVIECPDAILGFPEDMLDEGTTAGVVRNVSVGEWSGQEGDHLVRLIVELEEPAPYIVEGGGDGLTLTVQDSDPLPLGAPQADEVFGGEWGSEDDLIALNTPVSIDVQRASIHTVLRSLAEVSGKDIIASGDVDGKVTVRMRDIPWREALALILRAHDLGFKEEEDGVLRVGTLERLRKEDLEKRISKRRQPRGKGRLFSRS
jgi:type IV pilus assembly protein PilQ